MQSKHRIFWLYAVLIATLGGYAWHLQAQKKRQMAAYGQHYQTLLAAHNHLDKGIDYRLSQIRSYSDAYRMPELEMLRMQGEYVVKAEEKLSQFSHKEISRALKYDPHVQEWLPVQWHILSDSAAAAFFQLENDFVDSIRLFSRKYETELSALEPLFSNERRAAAERIITGNRPDQKAMFLAVARVRHAAAANHLLAFWNSILLDGDSRFPQIMPIPILEGTCHRAGETIRGQVVARSYSDSADNLTFLVHEKPVQRELGLGKFSNVFRSSGQHRLSVRVDVQNPLTGEVRKYTQKTTILVCE